MTEGPERVVTITRIDPFAPATEMLRALRAREISAADLLDLHLRRIERYNPALNAIVAYDADAARRAAAAADAARDRGVDGPLHGLPVTIKDYLDVRGFATVAGETARMGPPAAADSPVPARVRAAG